MAIELNCRSCGESFEVAKRYAGGRRPCPICGAENDIPRTSEVSGDFSAEERESLRVVGRGIGLILLAITIYVLFVIFVFVGPRVAPLPALMVIGQLGTIVGIGGPLLVGVGQLLCLSVPPRSEARGLATASFTIHAVGTVLSLLLFAIVLTGVVDAGRGPIGFGGWFLPVTIVSGVCTIVGSIVFVLFMARLAHFIDRPKTAGKAMLALWMAGGSVLLWVLAFSAAVGGHGEVTLVLGVIVFVVGLVAVLRYVGALSELRTGIKAIV